MRDVIRINPTMRQIAADVAEQHGLTLGDLCGRSRVEFVADVRRMAMLAVHQQTKFSLPQIGRFFNRDHTTVLYALRRARGETPAGAKSPRALAQQEAA